MMQDFFFSSLYNGVLSLNTEEALNNYSSVFYYAFFALFFLQTVIIIMLSKAAAGRKSEMNTLEKSHKEYRSLFYSLQEGFALFQLVLDADGNLKEYNLIDVNPAFEAITGFQREKVMNRAFYDLLPFIGEDNIERFRAVALTGEPVCYESYIRGFDKYLFINVYKPEQDKLALVFSDITHRKNAEEIMRRQNLSFEALFTNSTDAIACLDQNHNVVNINERFTDLFGYTIDEIYGIELDILIARGDMLIEANKLTGDLLEGNKVSMESIRFSADGQPKEVSVKGVPIMLDNEIIGGYGIYADISQRKKAEKEIVYMSYHDQLTGIYNRRFFEEEMKRLDTERNLPISVIMADVNGLKLYNDAFGHTEGDKLLIKTAEIIKKQCRADEIVARLGGDEFVILLPRTKSEQAEKIIKRIKTESSSIRLQSMELSISFGWETKKDVSLDISEIFKRAEDSMYRNKLFESPSVRGKTIQAIINSLHEKNKREEQHSQRVSYLCEAIGTEMNLSENELNELRTIGLLHDIGKIAIDEKILNKPDRLTIEEWNEIKRHPEIGYRILSSVNDMAELAEFVLAHHERWDGEGYPKGLKGEEIPLQSRIIAVADSYDAMTSERSYREPLSEKAAVLELKRNAASQFDPEIVRIFIEKVKHKNFKNTVDINVT